MESTASVRCQTSGYHGRIPRALKTPASLPFVISRQESCNCLRKHDWQWGGIPRGPDTTYFQVKHPQEAKFIYKTDCMKNICLVKHQWLMFNFFVCLFCNSLGTRTVGILNKNSALIAKQKLIEIFLYFVGFSCIVYFKDCLLDIIRFINFSTVNTKNWLKQLIAR